MIYDRIASDYDHFMRDQLSRACAKVTRLELEARGLEPPQRILDVACGTGLISKRLHEAGHLVTGIDLSEAMLAVARERFSQGNSPRFELADLTTYEPDEPYPVVLCFGDVLNHFAEPDQAELVAKRLFHFTASGGLFVGDTNTLDTYRSELWNREDTEEQTRHRVTTSARYDSEQELAYLEITAHRRLGRKGVPAYQERLVERYYSEERVADWLKSAGFVQVEYRPFNPVPDFSEIASQKTLWLARKE